jgi:hypothetical protein
MVTLGLLQNNDSINGVLFQNLNEVEQKETAEKVSKLAYEISDWVLFSYRPQIADFKNSELSLAIITLARKLNKVQNSEMLKQFQLVHGCK